jgi:glycosyltransferase involved in cell wall biosynthesis
MKILLSAYACEPGKGSEPGVGWNWALALADQGHSVHVLTRTNNRDPIEKALGGGVAKRGPGSLEFSYFDLPEWSRGWKHWPGGIQLYYLIWQWGAFRRARALHRRYGFDCVHHVTFAGFRQPSFMGLMGIPFLFGPVGGGETSPRELRRSFPMKGRVLELVRDGLNALARIDPVMALTYGHAQVIACTTAETQARIPARFRHKTMVRPTIGVAGEHVTQQMTQPAERARFLYVGRLLYWKGLHLSLRALAEVRRVIPEARLRVIGEGPDGGWLRGVARDAGVEDAVEWIPWIAHDRMLSAYRDHTAFIFPSLHDSGGMVVLEAMAAGLPVVCLQLGGPGTLVDARCGIAVAARGRSEAAVIESVAAAMLEIAAEDTLRARLAMGATERARELSWRANARIIYGALGQELVEEGSFATGSVRFPG